MHKLLFAIVLLYFCIKLIWHVIATPHTIQINGSRDQTFKIDFYFLYRCFEVVTTQVCVIPYAY